jgi:hypothetical protein
MALEKLSIKPLSPSALPEIAVLFNPNSYTIVKPVTWTPPPTSAATEGQTDRKVNAPTLVFGGGGSRQLTLELFFDVTEPIDDETIEDVREKTNEIAALTRIEAKQGRPPVCEIAWGNAPTGSDFPFTGVVSNLTQRFTLFRSTGAPVRATLTAVFVESLDPEVDLRQTDPELTTRVVKRGDTLLSIASEVYRDPSLWRAIAEANQVDDPRRLPIGRTLSVPKLR